MALAAVSTPVTRPRRAANQRFATVAASTLAIEPVPSPTTTPHSTTSCQDAVMRTVSPEPVDTSTRASSTTRRTPNRCMAAAANGPVSPNRTRLTLTARLTASRLNPSSCSGTSRTPGVERKPLAASRVRNATPATTQA